MMRRLPDLILILALMVGGVVAWKADRERGRLASEHARLARLTGDLPIVDPARVHVLALETGEPLHQAWRIYLPPHCKFGARTDMGNQHVSSSAEPVEFIARVRIREEADGSLSIYQRFPGVSSRGRFCDRTMADLLRGRFAKVVAEPLGAPTLATIGPDEPAVLMRWKLPPDLEAEARAKLTPQLLATDLPVIYDLKIGPEPPKPPPPPGN